MSCIFWLSKKFISCFRTRVINFLMNLSTKCSVKNSTVTRKGVLHCCKEGVCSLVYSDEGVFVIWCSLVLECSLVVYRVCV